MKGTITIYVNDQVRQTVHDAEEKNWIKPIFRIPHRSCGGMLKPRKYIKSIPIQFDHLDAKLLGTDRITDEYGNYYVNLFYYLFDATKATVMAIIMETRNNLLINMRKK
ncbi:hypothetical protein LCGC14_0380580 [marine sediment metagenome]|uniref:Uncharacterized protein n=1 Tax=marine sediment metagenome TaxID=412755 RepID=A0A0F9TKM7_9ZZZZ